MDKMWIAILSVILGSMLTVIGKYFTAKFSSTAEKEISFRESTLKRIAQLEESHDKLEKKIQKWTLRYWALYRWIINFCNRNNIDELPPDFHEVETQRLEKMETSK